MCYNICSCLELVMKRIYDNHRDSLNKLNLPLPNGENVDMSKLANYRKETATYYKKMKMADERGKSDYKFCLYMSFPMK